MEQSLSGLTQTSQEDFAKTLSERMLSKDKRDLQVLNELLSKYKEPQLATVPPRLVIPDFSNRGRTGLSVEHVHHLAKNFSEKGFKKRAGNQGHDVPVLIRESSTSDLGRKSIESWRSQIEREPGFPPKEHYEILFRKPELFTSLGNGHFNQALNLFYTASLDMYTSLPYSTGKDRHLKKAIYLGVQSVILHANTPLKDRQIISELLNAKR